MTYLHILDNCEEGFQGISKVTSPVYPVLNPLYSKGILQSCCPKPSLQFVFCRQPLPATPDHSKVMVVGTFKDQENKEESIQARNDLLRESLLHPRGTAPLDSSFSAGENLHTCWKGKTRWHQHYCQQSGNIHHGCESGFLLHAGSF